MAALIGGQRIKLTAPISSFRTPGLIYEPGTHGVLFDFIGTTEKASLGGAKVSVACWTADLDGGERVEVLTTEFDIA